MGESNEDHAIKADENSLEALRNAYRGARPDTMHARKSREKKARLKNDGRSSRARQPIATLTVGLPPDIRAQLTHVCRRNDILIKDFIIECLAWGFDKYGRED